MGIIDVELLDRHGVVIPGYSREDCDVITTDDVEHVVHFRGSPSLSGVIGRPVSLRFYMTNTELYALEFDDPR